MSCTAVLFPGESGDGQKDMPGGPEMEPDSGEADPPAIVFYMVDPFSYGNDWQPITRLAMLGILRCFREMLEGLPEHLQQNTQLQIIPQQVMVRTELMVLEVNWGNSIIN